MPSKPDRCGKCGTILKSHYEAMEHRCLPVVRQERRCAMSHLKPWVDDLLLSRLRSDLRGVVEIANSMQAGLDGRASQWNLQDLEAIVASMRRATDDARTRYVNTLGLPSGSEPEWANPE